MLLAAGGSRRAFEVLAERHFDRVARYCSKYLNHSKAGEELAQDLWAELWIQRRQYRARGRFISYVLTLARNRLRNAARNRARHERSMREVDEKGSEAEPLDHLLERERARQMRAAVGSLPDKIREAVLLRFDQDLDYAEISRVCGVPEVTARSRVFHGIKRLRAELAQEAL